MSPVDALESIIVLDWSNSSQLLAVEKLLLAFSDEIIVMINSSLLTVR